MHTVTIVICFFIIMIASNLLYRLYPFLPVPAIQIILGFLASLFLPGLSITLDSEMFLALIIAPLLFRDGQKIDVSAVLKHRKLVVYLAFLGVFVTVFALGYTIHFLMPVLPLAACLAIGASLGPTDVVAAGAVTKRLDFPKRVQTIIKGEGLINDASGLISFRFAILTLITGSFSAFEAGRAVIVSSIGGVVVGILVSFINRGINSILERIDAKDSKGYLIAEIFLPFLAFFLAEELEFSGIIAAVAAGVMQTNRFKKITLFDAQLDTLANTVWDTITSSLDAIVFIILGIELQIVLVPVLSNPNVALRQLFVTIILATILLFFTRFVLLAIYYWFISKKRNQPAKRYLSDALQITFSGVKGTVSIATILLVPETIHGQVFEHRPLILFVSAAVTFLSFIVGIIVLPMLAEPKVITKNHLIEIAILDEVVSELMAESKNSKTSRAYQQVIENYRRRIEELIIDSESDDIRKDLQELRLLMLQVEQDGLEKAYQNGEISGKPYYMYLAYTREIERLIVRNFVSSMQFYLTILRRISYTLLFKVKYFKQAGKTGNLNARYLSHQERKELRAVFFENTQLALTTLESLEGIYDSRLLDFLQMQRIRQAQMLHEEDFFSRVIEIYSNNSNSEELLQGYYLERKFIFKYEKDGRLTKREARKLRENVNVLESYSLKEHQSHLSTTIMEYLRGDAKS